MRKIPFSIFKADGYFTLIDQCIEVLKKHPVADDTDYNSLLTKLTNLLKLLKTVMLKASTEGHTQKIIKLDSEFGKAFKGFKSFLKACTTVSENADDADLLIRTVRNHGWELYNFGYAKQNSRAENLLAEFNNSENLQAALKNINATVWLERVTNSLNSLRNAIQERVEFAAELPKEDIADITKEINTTLNNTLAYVEIKSQLGTLDTWQIIINEINVVIDKNVSVAHQSGSRKKEIESETI